MAASYLSELLPHLAKGALVLTANKRLFRFLRSRFDQWMLEQGETVWSSPAIFSYEGWIDQVVTGLGEQWRVLSPQQAQCLWEQLVEASSRQLDLELLQVSRTAEKAAQAHRLLNEYEIELDEACLTEDQQAFSLWRQQYRDLCAEHDWLDRSELATLIREAFACGQLDYPRQLFLVGFDQLPPGLVKLCALFADQGGVCQELSLVSERDVVVRHYAAADSEDEIDKAALWTRNLLEQGAHSIGIVVPDLTTRRARIERNFLRQIDPCAMIRLEQDDSVFGLSLGGPLAEEGIIHAALQLLGFGRQLSLNEVSFLLRTPYLGGGNREADQRHLFDRRLRSWRQPGFSLTALKKILEKNSDAGGIVAILAQLESFGQQGKQAPGEWAACFGEDLKALGWPGDRVLSSREYQALKIFQDKVLSGLAALDAVLPAITRGRALALLQQLARTHEFQVEAPPSPVQVVGLLESSGLEFEHLWVMGMSETTLPAAPQPNPFVPYQLQRDYAMPHATAERELQFGEQVIARLRTAAAQVVFSYPCRSGDSPQRPSPLLPAATCDAAPQFSAAQDLLSLSRALAPALEILDDSQGPILKDELVEGGTTLLKDQAHCPFRAFVHHRLKCTQLDSPEAGISAMSRGDLVHLVLEKIWQKLGRRTALEALSPESRKQLIAQMVAEAIAEYFADGSLLAASLLQIEQERLVNLVCEWLECEEQRDDFVVLESEMEHVESLGPLKIRMKVDRIDQLADGQRVVIDYKTGSGIDARDFLSEPLIEPQLPIYAVADSENPADGVAFARVRQGECSFVGFMRNEAALGKVNDYAAYAGKHDLANPDWDQLLAFWKEQIAGLAGDFVAGRALVAPFDPKRSCNYCDLAGICRIQEYYGELEESE